MQGRRFGDLLTPESRKLALDYLSGLNDSGVASLLNEGREVEALAGAGSIPLFMTMGRISSEEGGRFCAVLRDITHWKRIESELTAAKLAAEQASQPEVGIPGARQPRDPHAAERHHRLRRGDDRGALRRRSPTSAIANICATSALPASTSSASSTIFSTFPRSRRASSI